MQVPRTLAALIESCNNLYFSFCCNKNEAICFMRAYAYIPFTFSTLYNDKCTHTELCIYGYFKTIEKRKKKTLIYTLKRVLIKLFY